MSNRPKIWAHCAAGCKWETVHKADFEESASIIRQHETVEVNSTPAVVFEKGKLYKIVCSHSGGWLKRVVKIYDEYMSPVEQPLVAYINDEYLTSYTFRLLDQIHEHTEGSEGQAEKNETTIVYELNGERKRDTIQRGRVSCDFVVFSPSGEGEVFIYNEDATITLRTEADLPTVTEADNGKVLMVVGGTWQAATLATYGGEYEVIE